MDTNRLIGYFGGWIVGTFVINLLTLFIVKDIRNTQIERERD
ncbi:hypothetical protein [Clostridium sp. Cult1]|nr:hypothetical protein [Clostridium sp. Cult1]